MIANLLSGQKKATAKINYQSNKMSKMLLRNPSLYYGNGRRRRVGRVVRRKRGGGFMDALKSAHNWIKSNKIISTVGNALGKIGVPYAGAIGTAAGTLGYGRRRRMTRRRVVRRRGGAINIRGLLSKVHGFVKNNQLVSKGLAHFGHSKLAGLASSAGYGKRRRTVRKRVVRRRATVCRHRANFFSMNQLAAPRFT